MPGINTTGAPNTRDYAVGRGVIRFALNNSATGLPDTDGFRDLGNAPEFTITQTTEELKHANSRDCLKFTDKRFVLSQEVGIGFQLDETRNFDNLAFFLSGGTGSYANPHNATVTDVVQASDLKLGNWYEMRNAAGQRLYNLDAAGLVYVLEKTGASEEVNTITAAATPATGGTFTLTVGGQTTAPIVFDATAAIVQAALNALSNVRPGDVTCVNSVGADLGDANDVVTLTWGQDYSDQNVVITANFTALTGTTHVFATPTPGGASPVDVPLVKDTDYEIDEQLGIFRCLPASVIAFNNSVIKLTISVAATTQQELDQVNALTVSEIKGTLLFIQDNAGDCGQKIEWRFHQANVSPDGDLPMIGDEVSVMSFKGVAEINSFITDPSQVLTVRTYVMV